MRAAPAAQAVDSDGTYSPRDLAQRYHCAVDKIHRFIRAGLLPAVDLSRPGSKLPRWRITQASLEKFEALRSARPAPKLAPRRRSKVTGAKDFF